MNGKHVQLVVQAADFAAKRHVNQRRKGAAGEPYFNHLAEVGKLLASATGGENAELVAAGFLHDVLEDTPTEYEELVALFGSTVANLVAEVTDDKGLPKAQRKQLQIDKAATKSKGARLLKIADKTSNLRSLAMSPPADWDGARALEYIDWAERVVEGCRGLNLTLDRLFDAAAADARAAVATEMR